MNMEIKQLEKVIAVFNSMMDHIGNNLLKSNPNQIAELIADFQLAKEAIENDNWTEEIQKGEGNLLQKKMDLIHKMDDLQLIIEKVKSMKAFW